MFSLDVVNLYGSIPIQEAISATIGLIKENISKINTYGLSLDEIEKLLTHVLTNNFIRFGTDFYKQTEGIAMGNRLAPPLAIVFMHNLESSFVKKVLVRPSILLRYIDDTSEYGYMASKLYLSFMRISTAFIQKSSSP